MGKKSRGKKSKGSGGSGGGGAPSSRSATGSATFGASWSTNLPTFNRRDDAGNKQALAGGMYQRYKEATIAVKDFLKSRVPTDAGLEVEAVNDLSKAAEHIMQRAAADAASASSTSHGNHDSFDRSDPIEIPRHILTELEVSIDLREQVSKSYGGDGGGDDGHRYMLNTLKHVRKVLMVTRKISTIAKRSRTSKQAAAARVASAESASAAGGTRGSSVIDGEIGGKFSALAVSDDEESVEEFDDIPNITEDMVRSGNVPTITAPGGTEEQTGLSVEHLIDGDDRFQCILFLRSLDMYMSSVDDHFALLKGIMRNDPAVKHTCNSTLQLLMECSVAVNAAINSVRQMEATLAADHEHLSSFYRILAVVVLNEYIAEIEGQLAESIRRDKPALAKKFVGDVLETSFHNRPNDKIPGIVRRFLKASKLKHEYVEKIAKQISLTASIEVMTPQEAEIEGNAWIQDEVRAMRFAEQGLKAPQPHSWLTGFYIGRGDRSILSTQKLTQQVISIVQSKKKLISKGNCFGQMWNESTHPAKKIEGDLNAFLAEDILPELIELSRSAPIHQLPGRRELLPLLDVLSEHMRDKDQPIPMSLTMGLHAILTSIIVLQGNGDVSKLAYASKQTWKKLFSQIDEQCNTGLPTPPIVSLNLHMFKGLVHLAEPAGPVSSLTSEMNAFWNPVSAGSFLLFGTYIMSIGLGSATVDGFAQLRFTLHLFNALKDQGLVPEDTELLSNLDDAFKNTKAIWVKPRPKKGEYVKSLLMAWGQSAGDASKKADFERQKQRCLQGEALRIKKQDSLHDTRNATRELDSIEPENFSLSYRRIVLQDFSDAVDDYSIRNCSGKQKRDYSDFLDYVSRVNMTRDAIDDDEDNVIPFNFVAVAGVLNEFIVDLGKEAGWDALLSSAMANMSDETRRNDRGGDGRKLRGFAATDASFERTGLVPILASVLGELDFASSPYSPDVEKVASFMKSFFTKEKKDLCRFFIEPSDAKETVPTSPLDGEYAYGRTGRTASDPLQGFMVCKHSKTREAIVRLIKPGKRTPYFVEDGWTESPYGIDQTQFKLQQKANGRYRHIASYSLEELIELGWDGAKYCPQNVKELAGVWVPYVPGYDSDPEDCYDSVDVAAGRRQGLIGLTEEDVGAFMDIPGKGMVRLNRK